MIFSLSGNWGKFCIDQGNEWIALRSFYGAEPGTTEIYHFPNRDFAMGYILQVEPEVLPNGGQVKTHFHWPLIWMRVSTALKNKMNR